MVKENELKMLALVIVGGWLALKVLENLGKDVHVYRCWNCNGVLNGQPKQCPWCDRPQQWEGL